MHPDMLLLVERLVIAMETMSRDVKTMSTYVFDISCSVSYLLKEKRERESIPVVTYDDGESPSHVTSLAVLEALTERVYSRQYEQVDERSLFSLDDSDYGESSFGDIASTSIDTHEYSDVLPPENNPVFGGETKIEESAEFEVDDESLDVHNMFMDSRNNVRILKEMNYDTQLETEEDDQAFSLQTTFSNSVSQVTPSESIAHAGFALDPVPEGIQGMDTSSNYTVNSDHTTFVSRYREERTSMATTNQAKGAKEVSAEHTNDDSEERSHKCLVCERSFQFPSILVRHMKIHTGERPYKCNECGKLFKQKFHLMFHMRSHTGERPYKCNECEKAFTMKSTLSQHMLSHTGELPFMCNTCGKAFRKKSNLNVHLRSHTGETPYKCKMCGKAFRYHNRFIAHMRAHPGEHLN